MQLHTKSKQDAALEKNAHQGAEGTFGTAGGMKTLDLSGNAAAERMDSLDDHFLEERFY